MIITKETDYGTISVSNVVFASLITDCIRDGELTNSLWPSTDKGKQVDKNSWNAVSDTAKLIDVDYIDGMRISLEFSVIIRFGLSIRRVTKRLADDIRSAAEESLGLDVAWITIEIAGVRSRKDARRNTKVVFDYVSD